MEGEDDDTRHSTSYHMSTLSSESLEISGENYLNYSEISIFFLFIKLK